MTYITYMHVYLHYITFNHWDVLLQLLKLFQSLRPPAAGPLSWIPEHWWVVIAGWGLLAGDCWHVTPRLSFVQGSQEAARQPRESLGRVLGELWEGSGTATGELRGGPGSNGRTSGGSREVQSRP